MDAIVRIVDDEETVRNSELFIFKLAGIPAVAYSSAEMNISSFMRAEELFWRQEVLLLTRI